MERAQIVELKRFAKQLQEAECGEETRAAARAILLLADEVESLTVELAAARGAEANAPSLDSGEDGDAVSWFRRTFATGSSGTNGSD